MGLDKNQKLLFNMLTGAIDVVNTYLYNQIKSKRAKNIDLEIFTKRGYCFNSTEALKKAEYEIQHLIQQYENDALFKFVVIPNYTCNLACDYCYEMNATTINKKMTSFDLDVIFQAMINISSTHKKAASITLMGGEPLLLTNLPIVNSVLQFASTNGWKVVIITNGATLTEYIPLFVEHLGTISEIQVTLDGPENIHDSRRPFRNGQKSFSLIIEGIRKAVNNKLKISIRINLDSRNIRYVQQLIRFLLKQSWLNFTSVKPYFYPMSDGGCLGNKYIMEESLVLKKLLENLVNIDVNVLQHFGLQFHGITKFIDALKSKYVPSLRYCDACLNQYVFDPLGYIYKCWFGIRNPEVFAIGRYRPKFIIDKTKDLLWHSRTGINLSKCRKCKFLYLCGGGCSEKAWEQYKNFYLPKCPDFSNLLSVYAKFIWRRKLANI